MKPIEALALVRGALQTTAQAGQSDVAVAALDAYLVELQALIQKDEQGVGQLQIETFKASHQLALSNLEHSRRQGLEDFKAVLEAGRGAMNAAMSINGAGSAAVLALLGHLVSRGAAIPTSLPRALAVYLAGVALAAIAYGVTYLGQRSFKEQQVARGNRINTVAITSVILSLLAFCGSGALLFIAFSRPLQ